MANLWVSRLIGDEQPGVTAKYTLTMQQFYQANSPLLPSGVSIETGRDLEALRRRGFLGLRRFQPAARSLRIWLNA